ncbi:MAG: ABC transporter ATP-binding protein [Clostridium perfringens]|nr:ABC transporter ATP-binding protein [Clostridium perfringens]
MEKAVEVNKVIKVYKIYNKNKKKIKSIIHKKFEMSKFYALNNISFTINKGETVGIIGNNGAGKSTLLKILTGVAFKTYGDIGVNGRISSLLELGSGFDMELSGYENIYFNGSLNGLKKREIDRKIKDIIDFADIGEFLYQPVKNYSSGMFARLAFSVAINIDPDILIVDEILSVGDIKFQVKCLEKFNDFKKRGKTILYVSHGLSTVKRFCDRAIWIDKGKIVDDGNSIIVVERYYNLSFLPKNNVEASKNIINNAIIDIKINKLSEEISYLNDLEIEIIYSIKSNEVSNASMVIEIRKTDNYLNENRENDQFVCSFNSIDSGKKIPSSLGNNRICFNLKNLNLMSGIYYLDIVFLSDNKEIYRKMKAYKFVMNDKYRGEGFIILEHKWSK